MDSDFLRATIAGSAGQLNVERVPRIEPSHNNPGRRSPLTLTDPDPIHLAEQVAARICHDLVGPVGATANGAELLAEDGGRADPEVVGLIANSARAASRRLQFFRVAFGAANALSSGRPLADARTLTTALLEDGKIGLDWAYPDAAAEQQAGRATVKTLLNLVLVALETLPRGGVLKIAVTAGPAPAGGLEFSVESEGPQARLAEDGRVALAGEPGDWTPRTIPARLARFLAAGAGATLDVEQRPDRIRMTARFPRQV